jgi:hypothetical protein
MFCQVGRTAKVMQIYRINRVRLFAVFLTTDFFDYKGLEDFTETVGEINYSSIV